MDARAGRTRMNERNAIKFNFESLEHVLSSTVEHINAYFTAIEQSISFVTFLGRQTCHHKLWLSLQAHEYAVRAVARCVWCSYFVHFVAVAYWFSAVALRGFKYFSNWRAITAVNALPCDMATDSTTGTSTPGASLLFFCTIRGARLECQFNQIFFVVSFRFIAPSSLCSIPFHGCVVNSQLRRTTWRCKCTMSEWGNQLQIMKFK